MPIRAFWLTLALGLIVVPAITHAQSAAETEEQARAHFRLGRAHYDNGNFAQAGIEFEEAYRISKRAALLYNIYLAYRDANDTRKAADALRNYLLLEKDIENRGQLESKLASLDRALASEAQQPAAATPAPAAGAQPSKQAPAAEPLAVAPGETQAEGHPETPAAPAAATAADKPPSHPFPIVPVVLMGTGGAMMATSIATGLMAVGKHSEWDNARQDCLRDDTCALLQQARADELNGLKSSGQTLALVTDILLFGGMAVAGTGFVLLLVDAGDSGESSHARAPGQPTAAFACVPGACQANLRAAF